MAAFHPFLPLSQCQFSTKVDVEAIVALKILHEIGFKDFKTIMLLVIVRRARLAGDAAIDPQAGRSGGR
jgi:hypothetical protein